MTYRKTWFAYVLWAAYAGLCVMLLAYTGYHIYAGYVALPLARLGALIVFPVLVCVYLALRLSCQAIRKRRGISIHGRSMLEATVVSVSFVFGMLYRLRMLLYTTYDSAAIEAITNDYYARALIRIGEEFEPMAHGLSQLYVLCLSVFFSFLGNGVISAILFQSTLQMLAMLLAFRVAKKAAGRLPACVVLLSLAFSDVFVGKIAVIDPECLYLVLYLIGLLAMLSFIKAYLTGKSVWSSVFGAVFTGILIGVLLYLELWSGTLLLFLVGLFTGKKNENERGRADSVSQRVLCLFVTLVSCTAGFFAVIGADAVLSGVGFDHALSVWAYPYSNIMWNHFLLGVIRGAYPFWACLFLAAAFLVFEFFRGGREQDYTLWMLVCVLTTPVLFSDFWVVSYGSLALFLWSVMAGLGVKNCVLGGQAEVMRAKIEEINATAEIPDDVNAMAVISEMQTVTEAAAQAEKPRYIENPLPLPKRHAKREMDYDHEVAESAMHYDVEIREGDDFDI